MALSVGEIEATLRLRDEMTAQLRAARTSVEQFGVSLGGRLSDAAYKAAASTRQLITEQTAYNQTVSKFMGWDLAEKATRYADAIGQVGGVTKLTRAEQAEVNKVMQEAIDKSQAMGEQVPLQIQRIAEATADAAAKTVNWGAEMTQLGTSLTRTGTLLTTFVTAPLAVAGGASLKFAADFESSMVKVENLTDLGKEGVAGLNEQVLDLAVATGRGPEELAHGLLVVASTGLNAKDSMEVLTESAKAASVGLGDTAEIGRAITAAMRAYGSENLNAATAAQQLFVAVREGGAEADQFARTLGRVFGIAAQLGVGFDEVTASVATFTRLGVNASEAVTALRGTLNVLLHPSAQTKKALDQLGLSADELRKSVRERGLAQTLIDLVKIAGDNEEAIGHIIPNVRALAGVLGNTKAQGDQYKQILGEIRNDHDAFDKAVQRNAQTLKQQWNQAMSEAKRVGIEFGTAVLPVAKDLLTRGKEMLGWLGDMVKWWSSLPAPVREAGVALAGAAAAVGPLLVVLGQVVGAVGSLVSVLSGGGAASLAGAAAAAGVGLSTVLVPALLAIAVPAALYEVVRLLVQIKGLWSDSGNWRRDAEGLASTLKNEMATAARLAGHEFQSYAEAHAFLQQRIRELQASNPALVKSLDSVRVQMKFNEDGTVSTTRAVADNTKKNDENSGALGRHAGAVAADAAAVEASAHVKALATIAEAHAKSDAAYAEAQYQAGLKETLKELNAYAANVPTAVFQTRSFAGAVDQINTEVIPHLVPNLRAATQATNEWGQALGQTLSTLPGLIEHAFTSGGGFTGALKAFGTQFSKDFFGEIFSPSSPGLLGAIGSFIPGFGQAFGAVVGPLASMVGGFFKKIFGSAGRDAVEEFAKNMGGFDALHAELLKLGDAGEQLWVKLTQGVGRNNPEQAKAVIKEIEDALKNIPPTMAEVAEQAGFKTTAQLEQAAKDAVKLWQYMKDSGQYTADAVQQAWQRAQDALKAAGNTQLDTLQKSYDAAVANLNALDSEIASLQRSIADEAPEEVMGVVEAQARARLEALQKERDAAAKHVEDVQAQLQKAIEDMAQAFKDAVGGLGDALTDLTRRNWVIPVTFEPHGMPTGGGGGSESPEPPSFANEGVVDRPTLALVGDASEPEYILHQSTVERLGQRGAGSGMQEMIAAMRQEGAMNRALLEEIISRAVRAAVQQGAVG